MKFEVFDNFGESAMHGPHRIAAMATVVSRQFGASWFIKNQEYLLMRMVHSPVWVLGDVRNDVELADIELHEDFNTALTMATLLADRVK